MRIDELLSVGGIILIGLIGGKISHRVKIPRVTGYMLVGLLCGPSLLGLISSSTLEDIRMINDLALGMILFAIGGEIEMSHIRAMGKRIIGIALAESFGAFFLVFASTAVITGDYGLAILLGSISMATAPGVTLLVIREYSSRGPLTESLLAVVAINNVLSLIVFRFFFSFYSLVHGATFGMVAIDLVKELIISVAIGAAIGGVITLWEKKIDDLSELLLVIVGGLIVGIGLARTLGISPLLISLIIGAVTNNLSIMHRLVYPELRQTEMPFYIAFFVLSGASLELHMISALSLLGVAYLFARPVGKFIGSYLAASKTKEPPQVTQNLGMALLPQAGVAIGLAYTISKTHPEIGQIITAVILSSVIVYEGIGPFLTRLALARAKEIHLQE